MQDHDLSGLDALADALAARLTGGSPRGPAGEPNAHLPGRLPHHVDPRLDLAAGPSVGLDSVEFTQSTQHNGSAGQSYGSNNAVPLVAYKTMAVRVYPFVRRGMLVADTLTGRRVTGRLTLSIGDRVLYETGPTRADGVRIGSVSRIERGLWDREFMLSGGGGPSLTFQTSVFVNCPLNFMVPAYYCRVGLIRATVRVWPVDDGGMSGRSASTTENLHFVDVPAPKVCLVRVNWVDSDGKVHRPSDASMLATLGRATRMLPFPYFESTILGLEVTSSAAFAELASDIGGCNTAWSALVRDLNITCIFTAIFGLGDIVYGMVPEAAIPPGTTRFNGGCGRGAGGGFVNYGDIFAHEVGHLYESAHVGVPGDVANDPDYPNYGGSTTSIGEVGIDTGTSPPTLFDPQECADIMSYRPDQWISPYTYRRILDRRSLHHSARVSPGRLRPLLFLDFRVNRLSTTVSRVEIGKTARIDAPGAVPRRPARAPSPVSLDLLDGNGRILATHHCRWVPARGYCGCGCGGADPVPLDRQPWLDFQEVVEWPSDEVASIVFHAGQEPFHTTRVGEAPHVSIEGPDRRGAHLVVRVAARHPREQPSIAVLVSADEGRTWGPVAFDPPDGEVTIAAASLSGRCLFRAIATAELRSAAADTEPFELAASPRRMYLEVPSGHCGVEPGPVPIAALVDTRGFGPVSPTDIKWSSDLDGDLGSGYALTPDLSVGRHEISVSAPDGLGGRMTERAIIIVGGKGRTSHD